MGNQGSHESAPGSDRFTGGQDMTMYTSSQQNNHGYSCDKNNLFCRSLYENRSFCKQGDILCQSIYGSNISHIDEIRRKVDVLDKLTLETKENPQFYLNDPSIKNLLLLGPHFNEEVYRYKRWVNSGSAFVIDTKYQQLTHFLPMYQNLKLIPGTNDCNIDYMIAINSPSAPNFAYYTDIFGITHDFTHLSSQCAHMAKRNVEIARNNQINIYTQIVYDKINKDGNICTHEEIQEAIKQSKNFADCVDSQINICIDQLVDNLRNNIVNRQPRDDYESDFLHD